MSNLVEQLMTRVSGISEKINNVGAKQEANEEILWSIFYELKLIKAELEGMRVKSGGAD